MDLEFDKNAFKLIFDAKNDSDLMDKMSDFLGAKNSDTSENFIMEYIVKNDVRNKGVDSSFLLGKLNRDYYHIFLTEAMKK